MFERKVLLAGASALVMAVIAGSGAAKAADAAGGAVSEVVVVADKAGLIEKKPSNSVLGLDKPLLETPRSASFVSDLTMERYGIKTVDNLVAISPGSFTASFYGVPGSLNIRGTLAENYFKGFKRLENRGTYSTPIGDAAEIEIVRGPPTPIYGAGKVGGLLNFIPKTALIEGKYLTAPTGEVTATLGSYDKKNITGQVGAPLNLGSIQGGVYAYGELDDSKSYYRGIHPRHQLAELSALFDVGAGWTASADYLIYHSDGDVQTPGWNRLTQDLINNRNYTTGRDTSLADSDGNGRLTLNEISPGHANPYDFSFQFQPLYQIYPFCQFTSCVDAAHTLDVGVGTTKLSPRTVYISSADFSKTLTNTVVLGLTKSLTATSDLKFQLFYDHLDNQRFVSYGFPGSYQSSVGELRATYDFALNGWNDMIQSKSFIGASYRYVQAHKRESFNSGVIALDRRDISFGATPTDIIDSPFNVDPAGSLGLGWENNVLSLTRDAGAFFTTDITFANFDLIVGGRYDNYNVSSTDTGVFSFQPPAGHAGAGKGTYTASLSYKTPIGLIPYATYDKTAALETAQASDIPVSLVVNNGWLSDSDLTEIGVKFQLLNSTLVGSLAAYRQNRTQLEQGGGVTSILGTRSDGVEIEVRYLATKNLSFTLAGNSQHTEVKGPDHSFAYIPASVLGVSGANGFGGTYVTFDFASLPGRAGDYAYTLIPNSVVSLYATYTTDKMSWGEAGFTVGGTHVSQTSGLVQNAVTYPAYYVFNASGYVKRGPYQLSVNVDNLFDKLYFTPDADSYANLGALPSKGREFRVTLSRKF